MNLTKKTNSMLDVEMERLLEELAMLDTSSKEYGVILERYDKLAKAKSLEKPSKVSPDTLCNGVFTLLNIGSVLGFERANVITTKAWNWIKGGRV